MLDTIWFGFCWAPFSTSWTALWRQYGLAPSSPLPLLLLLLFRAVELSRVTLPLRLWGRQPPALGLSESRPLTFLRNNTAFKKLHKIYKEIQISLAVSPPLQALLRPCTRWICPPRGLLCVSLGDDLCPRVLTALGASRASLPAAPAIPPTPTHPPLLTILHTPLRRSTHPPSTLAFIHNVLWNLSLQFRSSFFLHWEFFHLCLFSWPSGHLPACDFGGSGLVGLYLGFLPPRTTFVGGGAYWRRRDFKPCLRIYETLILLQKFNSNSAPKNWTLSAWPVVASSWCQSRFRLKSYGRISRNGLLQL